MKTLSKINRNFQVTLPKYFREQYDLKEGDPIEMEIQNNQLVVNPVEVKNKGIMKELENIFQGAEKDIKGTEFEGKSDDEIMEIVNKEIKEYRKEKKSNPKK